MRVAIVKLNFIFTFICLLFCVLVISGCIHADLGNMR
jgi:hypothetical protein